MNKYILKSIRDNAELLDSLTKDDELINKIDQLAKKCCLAHNNGGKIIFAGNGGSASDCQHLAAELIGRFEKDRPPLKSISLNTDTSVITALSNDYSYDTVYQRQLEILGDAKDLLVVISTSGNSKNILEALKIAKRKKIKTISFLGGNGGKALKLSQNSIVIPSKNTARVQEMHIFLGQLICSNVEKILKL